MHGYSAFTRSKVRGFSLTELAIVLGVAGIIMGAIWSAAGNAMENKRTYQATQQIMTVVQNIREHYMNAQGIPDGCTAGGVGKDITAALIKDTTGTLIKPSIFPNEMLSRANLTDGVNSALATGAGPALAGISGTFRVIGGGCSGATADRFRIVMTDVPRAACIKLLTSGVSYDAAMGITGACGSKAQTGYPCYANTGWSWIGCKNGLCGICTSVSSSGACTAPATPVMMDLAQAQAFCASPTSTSEVAWEFKLRR